MAYQSIFAHNKNTLQIAVSLKARVIVTVGRMLGLHALDLDLIPRISYSSPSPARNDSEIPDMAPKQSKTKCHVHVSIQSRRTEASQEGCGKECLKPVNSIHFLYHNTNSFLSSFSDSVQTVQWAMCVGNAGRGDRQGNGAQP